MRWTIVAAALVALGGCKTYDGDRPQPASAEALDGPTGGQARPGEVARERVAAGALLLDVRTPEEFAAGHIEGARNIPVQELAERLDELPDDRPLVVYCRSGRRSARAVELLRAGGHEDLFDLGPISNW